MNRLEMLNRKIANDEALRIEKEKTEEKQRLELIKVIETMQPRIAELMQLAEHCRINKKIDRRWETGKSGWFADGWNHDVGFMGHGSSIEYVGRYMGGACGPWDFYTNGFVTFEKHENTDKIRPATLSSLKHFIKDYDKFETAFYAWFDKEFGEEN